MSGLYCRSVFSGSHIKPMIQAWIFRREFETDPSNGVDSG